MSGRLTILPKKSYCPWKPENVERVLRDERLERERLEKEEQATRAGNNQRRRQQRREEDEPTTFSDDRHINLFPEAKEAELRLARGKDQNPNDGSSATTKDVILPVPLGGDEATKRKMGAVPFYMRPQNTSDEGKYDNTSGSLFRLGNRRNGRGSAAAVADEITSKITNDQYEKREDGRKEKIDPMSRFVGTVSSKNRISSKIMDVKNSGASFSELGQTNYDVNDGNGRKRSHHDMENHKTFKDKKHRKKYHKKKSHSSYHDNDCSSVDSDSISSYCSSSSSCSSPRPDGSSTHSNKASRQHKRRHSRKGTKRNSHSRNKPPSRSEERHGSKKSRRKRRRHCRHESSSSDSNSNELNQDISAMDDHLAKNENSQQLEELRKRRHAREAREMERERQVLLPPGAKSSRETGFVCSGNEGRYQNQFNPALSRN